MERAPENFPRMPADTAQKWNADDDMVKWEKNAAADQQRSDTPAAAQAALEAAAAGQLLSEDAAAAELPIHTDSEPVHTASALSSGPTAHLTDLVPPKYTSPSRTVSREWGSEPELSQVRSVLGTEQFEFFRSEFG